MKEPALMLLPSLDILDRQKESSEYLRSQKAWYWSRQHGTTLHKYHNQSFQPSRVSCRCSTAGLDHSKRLKKIVNLNVRLLPLWLMSSSCCYIARFSFSI